MAKKPFIILGADHAGLLLKNRIKTHLEHKGYNIVDIGTMTHDHVDYPAYAFSVAKKVAEDTKNRCGILVCGTGTGMVIAANKVKGIRASFCYDHYSAKMAREHNDANVLTLRGRRAGAIPTLKIVDTWLSTPFSGIARHQRRIKQIASYEVRP